MTFPREQLLHAIYHQFLLLCKQLWRFVPFRSGGLFQFTHCRHTLTPHSLVRYTYVLAAPRSINRLRIRVRRLINKTPLFLGFPLMIQAESGGGQEGVPALQNRPGHFSSRLCLRPTKRKGIPGKDVSLKRASCALSVPPHPKHSGL